MAIQTKSKRYTFLVDTPIGLLAGISENDCLQSVDFVMRNRATLKPVTAFDREIVRQLKAYFKDPVFHFDLPLATAASEFQQRLRRQLLKVKPGSPETYGSMAKRLQSAPRAVGAALRANPVPVVVPCHRVIAANDLGGFSGKRSGRLPAIKRWLLQHEQC